MPVAPFVEVNVQHLLGLFLELPAGALDGVLHALLPAGAGDEGQFVVLPVLDQQEEVLQVRPPHVWNHQNLTPLRGRLSPRCGTGRRRAAPLSLAACRKLPPTPQGRIHARVWTTVCRRPLGRSRSRSPQGGGTRARASRPPQGQPAVRPARSRMAALSLFGTTWLAPALFKCVEENRFTAEAKIVIFL